MKKEKRDKAMKELAKDLRKKFKYIAAPEGDMISIRQSMGTPAVERLTDYVESNFSILRPRVQEVSKGKVIILIPDEE